MINEELLTQTKKVNAETFRDALPSKVYQVLERKNSVCARSGFKLIMGYVMYYLPHLADRRQGEPSRIVYGRTVDISSV